MNINFMLILVLATAFFGLIWLVDALVFAPRRQRLQASEAALTGAEVAAPPQEPILVDYARSFFPVLFLVLVLRSFLFEPFKIPSGSMFPTLLVGDFILVNKFSYGVRLPVIHKKILDTGSPQRGDVAVFRYPDNPKQDYIKRVIGIPGDVISYQNKVLTVNGETISVTGGEPYLDPTTGVEQPELRRFREDLTGVEHDILINRISMGVQTEPLTIPDGHYWMMGDNRDHSSDSRYWGLVPEENLVGRAVVIWMNFYDMQVLWNRIGDKIK